MNYPEMLQVVDFSPLYQLAFTLYAAFIAVEYAKSFTSQVINRFYDLKDEIANRISENVKECRKEELQNIESDDYFKTGDGLCLLNEYNAKVEECKKTEVNIKKELEVYVDELTEYRIFRHLSMIIMLYCMTFMLGGAIYRVFPSIVIHFLLTFTIYSVIIIIVGWISAATRVTQSWSEKTSITIVGVIYLVAVFISWASLFLTLSFDNSHKEFIWTCGMIVAVLLPYMNFLYFFILVTIQMAKIRKHCAESLSPLINECTAAGVLMGKLLNHQEMMNKVGEHKKQEEIEKKQA